MRFNKHSFPLPSPTMSNNGFNNGLKEIQKLCAISPWRRTKNIIFLLNLEIKNEVKIYRTKIKLCKFKKYLTL
jgi:hypothetical protein